MSYFRKSMEKAWTLLVWTLTKPSVSWMCSLASLKQKGENISRLLLVARLPARHFYALDLPSMKGAALSRDSNSERKGSRVSPVARW